jgi:hypothetical protein
VWAGRDGGDLLSPRWNGVKHRNMLRDPPVSVTVIGSAGPQNCAELRGRVPVTPRRRPAGRHPAVLEMRGEDPDEDRPGRLPPAERRLAVLRNL